MAMKFTGSICLSDIPKECIKAFECKDGKTRLFLSISIHENKQVQYDDKGKVRSDHFISCAPKKEERKEDTNYIVGNLRTWVENPASSAPSQADINEADYANAAQLADLPF